MTVNNQNNSITYYPPTSESTLPRHCGLCKNHHMSFNCPRPLMETPIFGKENSIVENEDNKMMASPKRNDKFRDPAHEVNNNNNIFKNRNVKEPHRNRGPPPLMQPMSRIPFSQHPVPSIALRPPPAHARPSPPPPPFFRPPPHVRPPPQVRPPPHICPPPPVPSRNVPRSTGYSNRGSRRVNPGSLGGHRIGQELKRVQLPCPIKMGALTNALHSFVYGEEEDYEEVAMPAKKSSNKCESVLEVGPPSLPNDKMYVFKTRKCYDANGNCTGIEKRNLEYTLGGPNDAIVFVDSNKDFDF